MACLWEPSSDSDTLFFHPQVFVSIFFTWGRGILVHHNHSDKQASKQKTNKNIQRGVFEPP